jgi:hypothetical protein
VGGKLRRTEKLCGGNMTSCPVGSVSSSLDSLEKLFFLLQKSFECPLSLLLSLGMFVVCWRRWWWWWWMAKKCNFPFIIILVGWRQRSGVENKQTAALICSQAF